MNIWMCIQRYNHSFAAVMRLCLLSCFFCVERRFCLLFRWVLPSVRGGCCCVHLLSAGVCCCQQLLWCGSARVGVLGGWVWCGSMRRESLFLSGCLSGLFLGLCIPSHQSLTLGGWVFLFVWLFWVCFGVVWVSRLGVPLIYDTLVCVGLFCFACAVGYCAACTLPLLNKFCRLKKKFD